MGLKLYNTLTRRMEEFTPITEGFAGFYGCGPTVYNYAHIGNLRAYVFLDTLDRVLAFLGYKKKHVMNITDIGHLTGDNDDGEDKMLRTAHERHQSVLEVAKFYTDAFFKDIDALNIIRPDVVCKATEHIKEMIDLIKRIEANGHTYMAGGNLYYDVSTFAGYGALMGRRPEGSGGANGASNDYARVAQDANKRNPCDFVLWFTKSKFADQALIWDSPWGAGYPGWHIECSAMSMKYLGEHFDIHTGGIDHIPIHHTNEIAQSEGATGKKWVNYWLHNEFLVIDKGSSGGWHDGGAPDKSSGGKGNDAKAVQTKMSKSAGNFLTLQSLVDMGYSPMDYRYFLLGGHYRSQLYFSRGAMESSMASRAALIKRAAQLMSSCKNCTAGGNNGGNNEAKSASSGIANMASTDNPHINAFCAAIEDDLNTPKALAALQVMIKDDSIPPAKRLDMARQMDGVLGLQLEKDAAALNNAMSAPNIASDSEAAEIEALIEKRAEAKKAKDFAAADRIRAKLKERGILLTDTKTGTVWTRNRG